MKMRSVLVVIFSLYYIGMIGGQETTGSLSGQVLQLGGEPISFANIIFTNLETLFRL